MKNRFIQSIGILAVSLLLASPAGAQPTNLEVVFENVPLFAEINFLPGNETTRFATVTNNTVDAQQIQVEAINVLDPDSFGDILDITIKEGSTKLYTGTLSTFFTSGEILLSLLAGNGTQTQYDFTIEFSDTSNNSYQEKSLGFDLLIGFQGEEDNSETSEENTASITGIGGTGSLGNTSSAPGLIIFDQTVRILDVSESSATIEWETSYAATSQVIYALEGQTFALNLQAPNYGYPQAFPIPEDLEKVMHHSVIIPGLLPGSTYFFRAVSHASPATISRSYSFKTAGTLSQIGQADNDIVTIKDSESALGIKDRTHSNVPLAEDSTQLSALEKKLSNNSGQLTDNKDISNAFTLALPDEHGTDDIGGFFAAAGITGGIGFFGIAFAALGLLILFALSHKKRSEEKYQ